MKVQGAIRVAVLAMAAALSLMILCAIWPTPRTIGIFLGPGLALGALGVGAFGVRVIQDLRERRLL